MLDNFGRTPEDFGRHWLFLLAALKAGEINDNNLADMCNVVEHAKRICLPISDISHRYWHMLFKVSARNWDKKVRAILKRIQKKLHKK